MPEIFFELLNTVLTLSKKWMIKNMVLSKSFICWGKKKSMDIFS